MQGGTTTIGVRAAWRPGELKGARVRKTISRNVLSCRLSLNAPLVVFVYSPSPSGIPPRHRVKHLPSRSRIKAAAASAAAAARHAVRRSPRCVQDVPRACDCTCRNQIFPKHYPPSAQIYMVTTTTTTTTCCLLLIILPLPRLHNNTITNILHIVELLRRLPCHGA